MIHHFFAYIARLRYIRRWGLMRSSMSENDAEHSLQVAMLAHGMALIGKNRYGRDCNPEHIVTLAVYHDASEVITGDMPTPVKYYNDTIRRAYKEIEATAGDRLLAMLPEEFRPDYDPCFHPDPADKELWQLVKAADKISALIKCIEEDRMGNREFEMALRAQEAKVEAIDLPEVAYFRKEFMPAYYLTLDEHTKS